MSDTPQIINGELLRLKRESRGWLVSDMATRACMSTKQIRQLEEGGASAFYSESVKFTSAKKVGAILGLTPEEVFGLQSTTTVVDLDEDDAPSLLPEQTTTVAAPKDAPQPSLVLPDTRTKSEVLEAVDLTPSLQADSVSSPANMAEKTPDAKNKTPLGAIAALFVAALAVAAWMRPQPAPVVAEPPPPLQTLPAETPDPAASAASAETAQPTDAASAVALPASMATRPAVGASASASSVSRPAASTGSAATNYGTASPGPAQSVQPASSKPL